MKLSKLISALIFAGIANVSYAQAQNISGVYLTDSRGQVVKTGSGACIRTGSWTAIAAANDPNVCSCDADQVSNLVCMQNFAQNTPMPLTQPQTGTAKTYSSNTRQSTKITLSEDISFKFGQYALQQQAKQELDNVVNVANQVQAERIVVTGHTDRLGSDKSNLELSNHRAKEVKTYLVQKGLPFNIIEAKGVGEKFPITGEACKNMGPENRNNKRLVECLAPDRRVDIDIYGKQ
mgnify:CR=1 FL=1